MATSDSAATIVWHVFGRMNVGGAELRTLDLGSELAPLGIKFEYVTLSGLPGVLDREILESGSKVHPVPLSLLFPIRFVLALRRYSPDVVDSHVATFSGALVFLAWIAGVPVRIAHFRSDGDGRAPTFGRGLQRKAMKTLIQYFATHIVGVSPGALEFGFRADWRFDPRAQVIPNGLAPFASLVPQRNLREELGLSPSAILLMHVGRPSPEKNRPRTVSVLSAIHRAGLDAHLVLIGGEGVDAELMRKCIAHWGLRAYVHEIGQVRPVRALMKQADILLLTSTREGLPGVVIEALSVGTPVVASSLAGVKFIRDSLPGVISIETDSDSEWIAGVQVAYRSGREERTRESMIRAFCSSAFSIKRAGELHRTIYESRADTRPHQKGTGAGKT